MKTLEMIKSLAERNGVIASADVLAVFAALENAQQRIAELQARLTVPVDLPDVIFIKVSGKAIAVMHAERVKERVCAAGFSIEQGGLSS